MRRSTPRRFQSWRSSDSGLFNAICSSNWIGCRSEMQTSVSKIDVRRLAADVSAQHGIRVDPDDPMMAAVTLNKLVLEQVAAELMNRIQDVTNRFESAAERVQVRAGHVLAREVRE